MAPLTQFWAGMRREVLAMGAAEVRMLALVVQRIPPDRLSREETLLVAKLVRRAREMSE